LVLFVRLAAHPFFGRPGLWHDLLHTRTLGYLLVFVTFPLPLAFLLSRIEARDDDGNWIPGVPGWRLTVTRFRDQFLNLANIASVLLASFCIALIVNIYGSWKRIMPSIVPFGWDERLAVIDRVLHFGHDPWTLLQPLAGEPRITMLLDYLYFTWLPFTFLSLGWLVWSRHEALRARALVGVVFVWIVLGDAFATIFSSAGPPYYGLLVPGPDPFAPLFSYLDEVGKSYQLIARELQQALWSLHVRGQTDIYTGISAMPSVHVAMPALFTMIGWERNRVLGIAFLGYTILILLATVHLGWHYAIDGYASIALVWIFWRFWPKS
jgi:hypothetical protein